MRYRYLTLLPLFALTSCNIGIHTQEAKVFAFDTVCEIKLYEGDENNLKDVEDILDYCDRLTDNYNRRDITNPFYINNPWNEPVEASDELIDLIKLSFELKNNGATYFEPMIGKLSKLWKEKLKEQQIPSETEIEAELLAIETTKLVFQENNMVWRDGSAELDLGAIAKGYALDKVQNYLKDKGLSQYLVNAGQSSILLGEKPTEDGYFNVGLSDLDNSYLKLKNCFVSTSGTSEQGVKIGETTYSHIINPVTGMAINNYDSVIIVSSKGYFGDAMSTSLMLSSLDEVRKAEEDYGFKSIVIKDKEVLYKNADLEILNH